MKKLVKNVIYAVLFPFMKRTGDSDSIYITFDDGPHPENTLKILSILEKYNVKATFFMVGHEMEKYPDIVHKTLSDGHSIGYHSQYHSKMKEMSIKDIIDDMSYSKKLSKLFKYEIKTFRPPYGELTITGLIWSILNGCKIIMWSKDSRDSFDSKDKVINNVAACNLRKGEILLFHDDYKETVTILDEVFKNYKCKNIKYGQF